MLAVPRCNLFTRTQHCLKRSSGSAWHSRNIVSPRARSVYGLAHRLTWSRKFHRHFISKMLLLPEPPSRYCQFRWVPRQPDRLYSAASPAAFAFFRSPCLTVACDVLPRCSRTPTILNRAEYHQLRLVLGCHSFLMTSTSVLDYTPNR